MTRVKRIVITVIAIVVVLAAVVGIAFATAANQPSGVPEPGITVDGERIEDPGVVVSFGGNDVSFKEYRFDYLTNVDYYNSMYGESVWEQDYDGGIANEVKKTVDKNFQQGFAWLQVAKDENITLTDEEKEEIQENLATLLGDSGADPEAELGKLYYVDEETYLLINEKKKLIENAQTAYKDKIKKEQGDSLLDEGIATAKHILIMPDEENTDTAGAMAEAKEQAEDLLEQIRESEDLEATFDTLRAEYDTDSGQPEEGYTFGEGTMVDAFYDAALALDVDEISDLVESDYGYHIIMRLPLDESYVETNKDNLTQTKVDQIAEEYIEKIAETLTPEPGKYYEDITPLTIS